MIISNLWPYWSYRPCHRMRLNRAFSYDVEASRSVHPRTLACISKKIVTASHQLTIECFHIRLRCSSVRWHNEIMRMLTHISHENISHAHHYTENWTINSWDIPKSEAKPPTWWRMHSRTSHAILMHHMSFGTSHRECTASHRVAGPYHDASGKDKRQVISLCECVPFI